MTVATAHAVQDWHWIKVGTNPVYVAVTDDGVVLAVVYETGEEVGTDEDGDPAIADAGWFWFPVNGAAQHLAVEVGEPAPDELRTALDPMHDAALEAAVGPISAYLGGKSG